MLQFNFKKSLDFKILHYLTRLGLFYDILDLDLKNTWTTLPDSDWFYDILELELESIPTTLMDFDWFYTLDLDLKHNWTNVLDSDWFYYNKVGMLLEKHESLFELSVKQLVIQSSSVSLSHNVWCNKTKLLSKSVVQVVFSHKGSKFNLHLLREISMVFKMAMLTLKSSVVLYLVFVSSVVLNFIYFSPTFPCKL